MKVIFAFMALASSFANANVRVIQDMTCNEAVQFVVEHKIYYKGTSDGPVPMVVKFNAMQNPTCPVRQGVVYIWEETTDSSLCVVGYTCKDNRK